VEQRILSTDRTVGDKWLVTAGLKAGDRVIVEGLQFVRPGAKVKAIEADAATAGAVEASAPSAASAPAAKS
jgi:membrane fusion protein (multidrug efflux system)